MPVPFRFARLVLAARLFAIAGAAAIAAAACQPKLPVPPPLPPEAENGTVPMHPLTENRAGYLRLPNTSGERTPVRVGILLPFASTTPSVKALANAMLKSAELSLYDSGNRDIILMTADEGTTTESSQLAVSRLLDQGAEIIVGPLFSQSVKAVSHEARDRGVPVLAFSTDRSVAGDGIFLLGFLPENDVKRVISYAASQGYKNFAALSSNTAYGDVTLEAFNDAVSEGRGRVIDVERFSNNADAALKPAEDVAKSDADAVFIPVSGQVLRAISPTLGASGLDPKKVKLLGTS
jgi:branched-chain amino acid transport system substrate-binding protein